MKQFVEVADGAPMSGKTFPRVYPVDAQEK